MTQMLSEINEHFYPSSEVEQVFVYLRGDIDIENCADVMDSIIGCNQMESECDEDGNEVSIKPDVINLMITSAGGDMQAAFGLINVIRGSHIPVRTIALGEASSAALCIFMAGHQRVVTPYTSLMSHQFISGIDGPYYSMKIMMREFDEYYKKMVAFYHESTGLEPRFIKKNLLGESDHFFTPEKALDYKMADLISGLR
jgi:ATP-dependent protease ClpP protease subunit